MDKGMIEHSLDICVGHRSKDTMTKAVILGPTMACKPIPSESSVWFTECIYPNTMSSLTFMSMAGGSWRYCAVCVHIFSPTLCMCCVCLLTPGTSQQYLISHEKALARGKPFVWRVLHLPLPRCHPSFPHFQKNKIK